MNKTCIICGKEFSKPSVTSYKLWEIRTTCSRDCYYERMRREKIGFQSGHAGHKNSGTFSQGHATWNKGKKIKTNDALSVWRKGGGQPFYKGREIPEDVRLKLSEAAKNRDPESRPTKENHWNWKGGVTPLRQKVMDTAKYRKWRFDIFKRDNFTCQIGKETGVYLHVDHIKSFSTIVRENNIETVAQALSCKELWDISNGRTLCVSCHQKTDTYGSKSVNLS